MEKILVVEDEESVREVISEFLTGWGYETVLAENGQKGLELFRSQSFAMVVTDIRMPVMDGLTMLKSIRKEDAKIPIIVVTGYPTVDSAVESLVEGADYYLVKPVNIDDFKAKIDKAFEKRKIFSIISSLESVKRMLLLSIPIWIILGFILAKFVF